MGKRLPKNINCDGSFGKPSSNKKTKRDMANLTRNGVVGLELTREEVIEVGFAVAAIIRKAQCREVNCDIVDALSNVSEELDRIDGEITEILEEG